jgi:AraC-like DNA-binding protein
MSNVKIEASTGEPPRATSIRFSTADYAPRDRLEAWREIYGRALLKMDIEPAESEALNADVRIRKLPRLGVMTGARSATLYRRSRTLIDSDDVIMSLGLTDRFEATQLGRLASMSRNDAVVVSAGEPGYVRMLTGGPSLTLRVPLRSISSTITGLDRVLCRRIPADSAALRLLIRYVGILDEGDSLADESLQRHAVTHIHDLMALALGATREAAEIAKGRGVRAARLRAIKHDIADRLDSAELSTAGIAARHKVSPRYVRMLFEAEGTSFADYVLAQRLDRAGRMLADPRFAQHKIASVAFDSGFGDLSYFNRTFRARFGAPPSDMRARARRAN